MLGIFGMFDIQATETDNSMKTANYYCARQDQENAIAPNPLPAVGKAYKITSEGIYFENDIGLKSNIGFKNDIWSRRFLGPFSFNSNIGTDLRAFGEITDKLSMEERVYLARFANSLVAEINKMTSVCGVIFQKERMRPCIRMGRMIGLSYDYINAEGISAEDKQKRERIVEILFFGPEIKVGSWAPSIPSIEPLNISKEAVSMWDSLVIGQMDEIEEISNASRTVHIMYCLTNNLIMFDPLPAVGTNKRYEIKTTTIHLSTDSRGRPCETRIGIIHWKGIWNQHDFPFENWDIGADLRAFWEIVDKFPREERRELIEFINNVVEKISKIICVAACDCYPRSTHEYVCVDRLAPLVTEYVAANGAGNENRDLRGKIVEILFFGRDAKEGDLKSLITSNDWKNKKVSKCSNAARMVVFMYELTNVLRL